MELRIKKVFPSMFGKYLRIFHAINSKDAYLLGDSSKILLLRPNGSIEVVWQVGDNDLEEAWSSYFDHLPDELYLEITKTSIGFELLDRDDYKQIEASELYRLSQMRLSSVYRSHSNVKFAFFGKNISIIQTQPYLMEKARIRTRGKDPVAASLHPLKDIIVYGTNYGELFEQPFTEEGFGKSRKLDILPNTCYQIGFSIDGGLLIVAGLGFVKIYDFGRTTIPVATINTAARSFEIAENYLFLNKGVHGLDVISNLRQPERILAMDMPFAIDKMVYLDSMQTLLLSSTSAAEMAFVEWLP